MIKKGLRTISLLIIILYSLVLVACLSVPKDGDYTHPDYVSEYTSEQHIERITALAYNEFAYDEFSDSLTKYKLNSANVEILYAFYDNDPEFFLLELELVICYKIFPVNGVAYYEEYPRSFYIIGSIERDNYYEIAYLQGESIYSKLGYKNHKKYFGQSTVGIEENGEIFKIGEVSFDEERIVEKIALTQEQQQYYMSFGAFRAQLSPKNKFKFIKYYIANILSENILYAK